MTPPRTAASTRSPHEGRAPAVAVEAAEGGQVVNLTRAGRRIATLESAEQRLERLQHIAEFWKQREEEAAEICREAWDGTLAANASERVRQRVRAALDRIMQQAEDIMQQAEDAADNAAADAALADPASAIPAQHVWAELGTEA